MQRLTFIKTCFFRFVACILLAVSAGFVVVPEPSIYSTGKTFIKSHVPATDNYLLILNADDREDLDEDGYVDVQVSPVYFDRLVTFVSFGHSKALTKPTARLDNNSGTYITYRQLLI